MDLISVRFIIIYIKTYSPNSVVAPALLIYHIQSLVYVILGFRIYISFYKHEIHLPFFYNENKLFNYRYSNSMKFVISVNDN